MTHTFTLVDYVKADQKTVQYGATLEDIRVPSLPVVIGVDISLAALIMTEGANPYLAQLAIQISGPSGYFYRAYVRRGKYHCRKQVVIVDLSGLEMPHEGLYMFCLHDVAGGTLLSTKTCTLRLSA